MTDPQITAVDVAAWLDAARDEDLIELEAHMSLTDRAQQVIALRRASRPDPQTAADAAERVQAVLDAHTAAARPSAHVLYAIPDPNRPRGWLHLTELDLRALLADRKRMAAELEQVRGGRDASRDAAERANNLLMLLVFREGGSIQLSQTDLVRASESLNFWINSRAALLADLARLEADAERSDAEGAGKGPESHAEPEGDPR